MIKYQWKKKEIMGDNNYNEKMRKQRKKYLIYLIFRCLSKINKIDWSWGSGSQFEGMVLTTDGTILTGSKIQKRLKLMIICWILGKSKFVSTVGEDTFNQLTKDWRITNKIKQGDFPEVIYK